MAASLPTVYLDATIPSFYYEEREDPLLQVWKGITVQFWDSARYDYQVLVSDETIRELGDRGYPPEKRDRCLHLVSGLPRLVTVPDVERLAMLYAREGVMPSSDLGDAYHLAFATWYRVQYLLTWNCRHLANAHKFRHIAVINARQGLPSPVLVTPIELLEISPC
jgi:hypothetical protein